MAVSPVSPVPSSTASSRHLSSPPVPARERQVLLVGLNELLTAGMTELLRGRPGVAVAVAGAPTNSTARTDVLILDAEVAFRYRGTARLATGQHHPAPAVLALVAAGRPDLARRALERGADGLVSTSWTARHLVDTVLAAVDGRFVRPGSVAPGAGPALSDHELDVLRRVSSGSSTSEIVTDLRVPAETVETWVSSACRRIGVETRSEAVAWFFQHGFVDWTVPAEAPTAIDDDGSRSVGA